MISSFLHPYFVSCPSYNSVCNLFILLRFTGHFCYECAAFPYIYIRAGVYEFRCPFLRKPLEHHRKIVCRIMLFQIIFSPSTPPRQHGASKTNAGVIHYQNCHRYRFFICNGAGDYIHSPNYYAGTPMPQECYPQFSHRTNSFEQ